MARRCAPGQGLRGRSQCVSEPDIAYDGKLGFRMNSDEPSRARAADFLAAGGEMGTLMRATDWTRTPLGPPQSWPISLNEVDPDRETAGAAC
jgi:hypothetical protein